MIIVPDCWPDFETQCSVDGGSAPIQPPCPFNHPTIYLLLTRTGQRGKVGQYHHHKQFYKVMTSVLCYAGRLYGQRGRTDQLGILAESYDKPKFIWPAYSSTYLNAREICRITNTNITMRRISDVFVLNGSSDVYHEKLRVLMRTVGTNVTASVYPNDLCSM